MGASPENDDANAAAMVASAGGGGVVDTRPADGRQEDGAEGFPAIAVKEMEGGEEEEDKWVGLYLSTQSILLVGEGDFSFSLALATGFGSGGNLVATSLDCYNTLKKKYSRAESNLEKLQKMGTVVLYGVNAKTMKLHPDLEMRRFDRVVFNFPRAGFKGKEDQMHVINSHKQLVRDFFRSASLLLWPHGEVHVSHKTKYPYKSWNLEELAAEFALDLFEQAEFHIADYRGYNNKRGDGLCCDQPFMLGECSTFKFRIGDLKKIRRVHMFGSVSSIGNGRVYPECSASGCMPFHPPPLAPQWPQPYVPFDMFSMPSIPIGSEFSHHGPFQSLPGFVPQPNGYMSGITPQDQQWYQRTPTREDFLQKQARLRMLIAMYGRQ